MSFLLITKQHFFLKSIFQLFSTLFFFLDCILSGTPLLFCSNLIFCSEFRFFFCSKFDSLFEIRYFLLKIRCPIRRFRPPANRLPAGTCRSWTHRLTNESEENYQNIWIKFPFDRKSNFARTRMKLKLFSKKWTYYSFIQASLSSSLKIVKFLSRGNVEKTTLTPNKVLKTRNSKGNMNSNNCNRLL